jgi:hypothetical protein
VSGFYGNFEIKYEGVMFHGVGSLEWFHLLGLNLAIRSCASLNGGRFVGSYKEGLRLQPTVGNGHVFCLQRNFEEVYHLLLV